MTDGGGLRLVSVAFGRHIKRRYVMPEPEPGPLQRQATRYAPMTLTRHPVVQSIAAPAPARVAPVAERVIEPARPAPVLLAEAPQSPAPAVSTSAADPGGSGPGPAFGTGYAANTLNTGDLRTVSQPAEPPAEALAPPRAGFTMEEVRRALQRPRPPAPSQPSAGYQAARQARVNARPSGVPPVTPVAPAARARPVSQLYEQPAAQQAGTPAETLPTPTARGPARAGDTVNRPTSRPAVPPSQRSAESPSTVATPEATASPQGQSQTTPQTTRRETAPADSDARTPAVPVRPVTDLADGTAEAPPVETREAGSLDASASPEPLRRETDAIFRAEAVYRPPDEGSAYAGPATTSDVTRDEAARVADTQPALSDSQPIPESPTAPAPAVTLRSDAIDRSEARQEQREASGRIPAGPRTQPESPEGALSTPETQSLEPAVELEMASEEPPVRRSPDAEAPGVTATTRKQRADGAEDTPVQSVPASFDLAEAYRAQLQRFATEASTETETVPPWPEPTPAQGPPSTAPPIEPQTLDESAQRVQEVSPAQRSPASAHGSAMSGVTPAPEGRPVPVRRQADFADRTPVHPAMAEQQRLTPGALQPLPRQVLPIDKVVASTAVPTRVTRDRQDWPGPPIRRAEAPADTTRADSSTETAPAASEESPQAERGPDIDELADRVYSKLRDRLRVERERLGGSRLR